MMTCRNVWIAASLAGLFAGCDKPPVPAPAPVSVVAFGDGFYKEEATAGGAFRWARQTAHLTIDAPSDGRFEVTFQPVTVFSTSENTIEVSANGQAAGKVSTHTFDLSHPESGKVTLPLRQGVNAITLKSSGAETRLGPDDDRSPAFGLVMPVAIGQAPQ